MTKPKPKHQLQKRGRKSDFRPEHVLIAKACARFGAIEEEIADELHINHATLDNWKKQYPEFRCALKAGKEASDDRVERSLYQLAIGWNGNPPNVAAAIFWLKNRRRDRWRDVQQIKFADRALFAVRSPDERGAMDRRAHRHRRQARYPSVTRC